MANCKSGFPMLHGKTMEKVGAAMNWSINCSDYPIDLLGVKIRGDDLPCAHNFEEIMIKVHKFCDNWFNRKTMLYGQVLLINTLIGSLFVYRLSTMLTLSDGQITKIEEIFQNFLWNKKKVKISLKTLQQPKCFGGLRLVDLRSKQNTLMASWVFRIYDTGNDFLINSMHESLNKELGNLLWRCNLKAANVKKLFPTDNFWGKMLLSWSKIHFRATNSRKSVMEQVLWLNSEFRISNQCFNGPIG